MYASLKQQREQALLGPDMQSQSTVGTQETYSPAERRRKDRIADRLEEEKQVEGDRQRERDHLAKYLPVEREWLEAPDTSAAEV
jgi:hypothetical protein